MNIMSNASQGLDEASKKLISKKASFPKLCDLLHNDFMIASHVKEFHGNSILEEQSKTQIQSMLEYMKDISGFRSYFVTDLFNRALSTLERCANKEFEKMGMFTLKQLRKATDGIKALDPLNLLFFNKLIVDLGYVEEGNLSKTAKSFFDLSIGYAMIFNQSEDYWLCLDLLKMAKHNMSIF
jgi:hypothetical protein